MEERKRITAEEEAAVEAAGGGENADENDDKAKKVRKPPPRTLIDDVFAGMCRNVVTCLLCGTESVMWEPTVGLSVTIPERFHQQLRSETAAKKVLSHPSQPRGMTCCERPVRRRRHFGRVEATGRLAAVARPGQAQGAGGGLVCGMVWHERERGGARI